MMPARLRPWLAAAALLASGCGLTIVRSYSREQLNAQLQSRFPVEARHSVLFVRLVRPNVLLPSNGRIAVDFEAKAGAAVVLWRGRGSIEGTLEYRPQDGGLYLRDPAVRSLSIDGLPAEWHDQARALVEGALIGALAERPIYVLDAGRGGNEARARAHLRRVWVENDKLMLELKL
jgi:hypothetical protein